MAPSPSKPLAPVNPCPDPHISPIAFEFSDILTASVVQEHATQAERALRAYWAQAANMEKTDQQAYIRLLETGSFAVPKDATTDPSKHPLYKELAVDPSWPKYVMLKAICDPKTFNQSLLAKLDNDLKPVFGSLDIKDFTSKYQHAGLAKRKREQESETDDDDDIPSRIAKKQSSDNSPAEKTATTTRVVRFQTDAPGAVAPKQTTSYLTTRRSRGGDMEKALKHQNALLIKRCDALEAVMADLQRKTDAGHLNLVVLLTTILEKVTQTAADVDVMRGEWGL